MAFNTRELLFDKTCDCKRSYCSLCHQMFHFFNILLIFKAQNTNLSYGCILQYILMVFNILQKSENCIVDISANELRKTHFFSDMCSI